MGAIAEIRYTQLNWFFKKKINLGNDYYLLILVGLGRSTSIRDDYLTDTVTDGDDEILESLVKTATRTTTHPRERKRSNRQHINADRSARNYRPSHIFLLDGVGYITSMLAAL